MGLKRAFGYAERRSSGCVGFLRPGNGLQKDPKWVFSRSLHGLSLFRASSPTRVRRNARKRQRPAFDGAPPAKANGDRVASTRPAGVSPAVAAAVDVRFAEAIPFHDVDVLPAGRILHSRRDTTLLCGFPRISMQLEHLASPVRRNECEICIERRRTRLTLRGLAERTGGACAAGAHG